MDDDKHVAELIARLITDVDLAATGFTADELADVLKADEPALPGAWADGAAHTWLSDRVQTTVLEFDRPARNDVHPTMKPVDRFAGSGTTRVACEHTERTAALVELDPRYCDVLVKKYVDSTGQAATACRTTAAETLQLALPRGATQEGTAKKAGLGVTTVRWRLQDSGFVRWLRAVQEGIVGPTAGPDGGRH